jgi:hypothetical protein
MNEERIRAMVLRAATAHEFACEGGIIDYETVTTLANDVIALAAELLDRDRHARRHDSPDCLG